MFQQELKMFRTYHEHYYFPQEVIRLPRDDQIVLIESFPPIRSQKIKYFEDKFFTKRLLPPTFIPTQTPFDPKSEKASEAKQAEESV